MFERFGALLLLASLLDGGVLASPPQRSSFRIENTGLVVQAQIGRADFNSDGFDDLALQILDRTTVYLNDTLGRFVVGSEVALPLGSTTDFITAPRSMDMDNDGAVDLIMAGRSNLFVMPGIGNGTFEFPIGIATSEAIRSFTVGEVNDDGWPDGLIATCCASGSDLSLHAGGTSFLDETGITVGDGGYTVVIGNFDGDAFSDFVHWAGAPNDPPRVTTGSGNGEFRPAVVSRLARSTGLPESGRRGLSSWAGNLDEDVPDEALILLHGNIDLGDRQSFLFVLDFADDGYEFRLVSSFYQVAALSRRQPPRPLIVEDFDGDGRLDVAALAGNETNEIVILHNEGTTPPSFRQICSLPLAAPASSLACGFFDDDEWIDLAAIEPGVGRVELVFRPLEHCSFLDTCTTLEVVPGEGLEPVADVVDLPALGLRSADLSGDGRAEILTWVDGMAHVEAWTGTDLQESGSVEILPGAIDLELADVDGDGRSEVITVDSTGVTVVFLGEDLATTNTLSLSVEGLGVAAELELLDVDGDGRVEIALTLPESDSVAVFPNLGEGKFGALARYEGGPSPEMMVAGDFDGDGFTDLVVRERRVGRFSFLPNSKNGSFEPSIRFFAPGFKVGSLAATNLYGDGREELVAGGVGRDGISLLLFISILDDASTRTQSLKLRPDFGIPHVFAEDILVGDARDVLIVSERDPTLTALQAFPNETFSQSRLDVDLAAGTVARAVTTGDVDGNGVVDVVVLTTQGESLVYLSRGCKPRGFRRGDANLSGGVELADAMSILLHLFAGGGELLCEDAADVDDDGVINLNDAFANLLYLFRGGSAPPAPGPFVCGADLTEDSLAACGGECK